MNGKLLIGPDEAAAVRRELREAIFAGISDAWDDAYERRIPSGTRDIVVQRLNTVCRRVERALDLIEMKRMREEAAKL